MKPQTWVRKNPNCFISPLNFTVSPGGQWSTLATGTACAGSAAEISNAGTGWAASSHSSQSGAWSGSYRGSWNISSTLNRSTACSTAMAWNSSQPASFQMVPLDGVIWVQTLMWMSLSLGLLQLPDFQGSSGLVSRQRWFPPSLEAWCWLPLWCLQPSARVSLVAPSPTLAGIEFWFLLQSGDLQSHCSAFSTFHLLLFPIGKRDGCTNPHSRLILQVDWKCSSGLMSALYQLAL